jgi:hypothetical protein
MGVREQFCGKFKRPKTSHQSPSPSDLRTRKTEAAHHRSQNRQRYDDPMVSDAAILVSAPHICTREATAAAAFPCFKGHGSDKMTANGPGWP